MDEKYPIKVTSPKLRLISRSSSSKRTFLSAQMFLLRLSFSNSSWFFSLRNLSLSKVGEGKEVEVLLALVFLIMMLRNKTNRKEPKRKQEKPRADCKLAQLKYRNNNSI